MALIAMCVYDTPENKRVRFTQKTLESLTEAMCEEDRLIIVNNGSTDKTSVATIHEYARQESEEGRSVEVIDLPENVGTAKGINEAWKRAEQGEYLVKMDNDVVIHCPEVFSIMETVMHRVPKMGILGLKRKDLLESPYQTGAFNSTLHQAPHEPGEPWYYYETVNHVMGTCQMYAPGLIEKIGGLYQMDGLYGFDDSLAAVRCQVAGYFSAFIPHIEIDHIDPGDTPYQKWKEGYASDMMGKYNQAVQDYRSGKKSIYTPL
jgi:GT2 family glycosyltransferase